MTIAIIREEESVSGLRDNDPMPIRFGRAVCGDLAQAWGFVDEKLPPGEILAYGNTFLVHPLSGFDHARPLVYVPTRRGVAHVHDLPRLPGRLPGERLEPLFVEAMTADTDPDAWLARLIAALAPRRKSGLNNSDAPSTATVSARRSECAVSRPEGAALPRVK